MVTHKTIYPEIRLQFYFIKENCQRLTAVLTSLEAKELPLACTVYNTLEDLRSYLRAGTTKTSFEEEANHLLQNLPLEQRRVKIKSFQAVFSLSLQKLEAHIDNLHTYPYYKAIRIFDPRQLAVLSHDISDYCALPSLQDPSPALLEEWLIYVEYNCDELPNPLHVNDFWKGLHTRFPNLAAIAMQAIWMPVASVEVERSFSQYKHLLNDHHEENTK